MYTPDQAYEFSLLLVCIWREARGESEEAKHAVGWCIRNRAMKTGQQWYGNDWEEVILKPYQFSSFNGPDKQGHVDPNSVKFPLPGDPSFQACKLAAKHVYEALTPDPTAGATYYYDDSMKDNPPPWAKTLRPTVKIGRLNFFKEAA